MSQDADFSEDPHPESAQKDHLVSEGISACSCESAPVRITCSVSDQHCCVEGSNHTCRSQAQMHSNEVFAALWLHVLFDLVDKNYDVSLVLSLFFSFRNLTL